MFRALSDIWDGAFSRDIIGFELWVVFVESVQRYDQRLLFADASLGSEYVSGKRQLQN